MLALITGQGRLPEILAEQSRAQGRDVVICGYADAVGAVPADEVRHAVHQTGDRPVRLAGDLVPLGGQVQPVEIDQAELVTHLVQQAEVEPHEAPQVVGEAGLQNQSAERASHRVFVVGPGLGPLSGAPDCCVPLPR